MPPIEVAIERRLAAPHPGPVIKRDYLDTVGIDVPTLASGLEIDSDRLAAMLAGHASIDVDTAIRLSRALGLPAERIMQMQLRADFATARSSVLYGHLEPARAESAFPFPKSGTLSGRLGCTSDEPGSHASYFFQETIVAPTSDRYAGLHALWRGDCLRIFAENGDECWCGPVLQNLDGRTLLPFVGAVQWQSWFAARAHAELAIGPDHAEFFARMKDD